MSGEDRVFFSQEFKLSAVRRMLAGENVMALSRELGALRKSLYVWRDQFRTGGAEALLPRRRGPKPGSKRRRLLARASPESGPAERGPPSPTGAVPLAAGSASGAGPAGLAAARARIAELEQKVGQQALELDFFQQALRHFRAARQPGAEPGATATTPSSER